jgi:hypothetical protein
MDNCRMGTRRGWRTNLVFVELLKIQCEFLNFILCKSNTNSTLHDVRLDFIGFIRNNSPLGKL